MKKSLKFSACLLLIFLISGCLDRSGDKQAKKLIQDLITREAWEECIEKSQVIPEKTKSPDFQQQSLGLCAFKLAEVQANNNDFHSAFTTLEKIPDGTEEAGQKAIFLEKWSRQIIGNAQEKATQNNYKEALTLLKIIPKAQIELIDSEVLQLTQAWNEKIIQNAQSVYETKGIEQAQGILVDLANEQKRNNILAAWKNTDKQNAEKYAQISNAFDAQKWTDVINFYQGLSTEYWRQRSGFFIDVAQKKLAQPQILTNNNNEENNLFAAYKYRASQNNVNRTRVDAYINPKNVNYNEEIKYYSVKGRNKQELTSSIISANISGESGVHAAGLTQTSIGGNWAKEYKKINQNESCTLAEIKLELDVVILLPKWIDYNAADTGLKSDWDMFAASVEDHEHDHKNISRKVINELDKKLSNLGTRQDCATLDREVKTIWERSLAEHDELHRQYDIREGLIQI